MKRISNIEELIDLLKNEELYIYGAGAICFLVTDFIDKLNIPAKINGIVVANTSNNPKQIANIPVTEYSIKTDINILLLALSSKHTEEVLKTIDFEGEIVVLESDMENQIRNRIRDYNNQNALNLRKTLEEEVVKKWTAIKKDDVDVMLLTPPYWDIYAPFSATACLTASLKQDGYETVQSDIGIKCFRNALDKNWRSVSQRFLSQNYYNDVVKEYEKNTYPTFESYETAMWFFTGEHFDVEKVKKEYRNMSYVQRRVIDEFYRMVNDLDTIDINFDEKGMSIIDSLDKYAFINLLETLMNDDLNILFSKRPMLLGFSITSSFQFLAACEMASILKQIYPQCKLVFGGSCADLFMRSAYPNKKEIYQFFDYVLIGEGETALTRLVEHIEGKIDVENIPNLVSIGSDNTVHVKDSIIENVLSLPTPDYDGLDLSLYMAPDTILPYQSSRGCHYGYCAFCNHDEKYRHNYRSKQVKKVVDEMLILHRKYNVNYFQFVDEAIRPDCFKLIVEEMSLHKEFKEIKWFFYSRVSREYTAELIQLAKKNGCEMVMFGIESFNQRLLNFIKKGISADTSRYCLKLFHENGIKTYAWLMSALPSETIEEAKEDFNQLTKEIVNIDSFCVGEFFLSKNTDMYLNPEQYNITRVNEDDPYDFDTFYENVKIDRAELLNFVRNEYSYYQRKRQMYDNRYTVFFEE